MRSALFWDITRRRLVIVYRRFETTYRSQLHGTLDPWRWDRYVVPKRRYKINTRRRVIFQKSADVINIAAEAWNQRWPQVIHKLIHTHKLRAWRKRQYRKFWTQTSNSYSPSSYERNVKKKDDFLKNLCNKGNAVPVKAMKSWGSRSIPPFVLNSGTWYRWIVRLTTQLLSSQRKCQTHQYCTMLGVP
jgi:hypothetical protein